MTDLRKAANMALQALEFSLPAIEDFGSKEQLTDCHRAITALYKSLAQPEPVVSFTDNEEGLWVQLECNGSYYSQNLSESKTAKFFVNAYRSKNT